MNRAYLDSPTKWPSSSVSMNKFDVMEVGSGSGLEVSSEAVERGLSVAVVDEGPFGGTCLDRGCILSKVLIHSADVMETFKMAE